MEIGLFFWVVGSMIVGAAAGSRGRIGLWWFVVALVISPVLGLVLVLVLPNKTPMTDIRVRRSGFYQPASEPAPEPVKTCPRCAEHVKSAALVCRFCGHEFQPVVALPTVPEARRYGGVPYTVFPDGSVEVILGRDRSRMSSEADFMAFIDEGQTQKRG